MLEILVIDNFDSFTYSIVYQLRSFNYKVVVYRNIVSPTFIYKVISKFKNPILLFSPGYGKPCESGYMLEILENFKGKIPIIGICLGYQAIIQLYGGSIVQSKDIFHGKTSLIFHDEKDMFYNVKNPLIVGRYHSLIGKNISKFLIINSIEKNNLAMSVKSNLDRICGFQFHPESILTLYGSFLLKQTIIWASS